MEISEDIQTQNGAQPSEPLFSLPLSDFQAVMMFLQREVLAGQEASALLNKLAAAKPVASE